jgi:hypothetical protein
MDFSHIKQWLFRIYRHAIYSRSREMHVRTCNDLSDIAIKTL